VPLTIYLPGWAPWATTLPTAFFRAAPEPPLQHAETLQLLAYLAAIPDLRDSHGRHPLIAILAMAAAAVLSGAHSMTAIAEWAADAPQPVRAALGARRDVPDHYSVPAEATTRRILSRLDADAVATAIGAWLADATVGNGGGGGQLRSTARRSRCPHTPRPPGPPVGRDGPRHPCGARPTPSRRRPRRGPAFQPLLDGLDLAGVVITADALHTHADAAEFLVTGKQAHYLFTVKANQPTLLERCAALAWHNVPVGDRTRDRAHGRVELRTLKAVTVHHFGFPHAAQVLQGMRTSPTRSRARARSSSR
jgi:hypothetical protein